MTAPAAQFSGAGTVTPIGGRVVIEQGLFEGKDVGAVLLTLAGATKLVPQASDHDETVLTIDDIATVQVDVRVTGVNYEVDKNGNMVRVQRVKPIEGTATVLGVVRKNTNIQIR